MNLEQENTSNLYEVTERLQDFLTNKESENIVLTGAWGTGKTQAWKHAVSELQEKISFWHRSALVSFVLILILMVSNLIIPSSPKILLFLRAYKYIFLILYILLSALSFVGFWYFLSKRDKFLARMKYAYVSAVDCENLKDLKEKIITSTLSSWQAGKELTPWKILLRETILPVIGTGLFFVMAFLVYYILPFTKPEFLKSFPILGALTGFLGTVFTAVTAGIVTCVFKFFNNHQRYYLGRNAIVCIDDIERASKKLEPQEILNLAGDLKDNNNCKVALILNPDQFYDEKGNSSENIKQAEKQKKSVNGKKEIWQQALEKGSDSHLVLELDAKSAAKLAFGDENEEDAKKHDENDPLVKALRPQVIALGINNVRIIQHIWRDLKCWKKLVEEVANEQDVLEVELYECLAKYMALFGIYYYHFDDRKLSDLDILPYYSFPDGEGRQEQYNTSCDAWLYLTRFNISPDNFLDSSKKDWNALAKIVLENIKNGYLVDKNSAKKNLENYASQLTSKKISELVEKPLDISLKEWNPAPEIRKILLSIPREIQKIKLIGLRDANILLYFAGKVRKTADDEITRWEKDFKKHYIESLKGRDPNFFKNDLPFLPEGVPIDSDLKSAFENSSLANKEREGVSQLPDILDDILSGLNSNQAQIFYKEFEYEEWSEISLKSKLVKFTPQEICNMAKAFFYSSILQAQSSQVSIYGFYREKKKFPIDLSGFRAFQKLGSLLYLLLKKYWETKEIMNPALGKALYAYPWQELIDCRIPSDEEIKEQAEKSLENTDQKELER